MEIGNTTISWVATEGTYFLLKETSKGYSLAVGWTPETPMLQEVKYYGSDPLARQAFTVVF